MKRVRAFTLVELLVVMAIIGILVALALPSLARSMRRADQIHCLNNLRQIGISFQQFADDHQQRYPMQVSATEDGALEATEAAQERIGFLVSAVENFIAIERELVTPKLLVCRADQRKPAENFTNLRADQVSYLVATNARPGSSISVLAADRNLEVTTANSQAAGANAMLLFAADMHQLRGNVLLADGRVEWLRGLGVPPIAAQVTRPDESSTSRPDGSPPRPDEPPRDPDSLPDRTNDTPATSTSPAVIVSANRTPRLNFPPATAMPPEVLATNEAARPVPPIETPGQTAVSTPSLFIPLSPADDPTRSRWWWWLLLLLVLAAWWYARKHNEEAGAEPAVRGAPAGVTMQNAVAAPGTLAQTVGVKKFFSGAAINADLLVTMLDKHGINARQEFARDLMRAHEDEFSREAIVYVPEADYDRAYQLFYAERQDEL